MAALLLVTGSAAVGAVPTLELRFEERVLIGLVATVLLSTVATYLLSLMLGLNVFTSLAGPAVVTLAAASVRWRDRAAAALQWRTAWRELLAPSKRTHRLALGISAVATTSVFAVLFAHTLTSDGAGDLNAGFQTVWADWSQHLTTASSFAVAHNLPPQNPLFSGQDLRYPFLPDLQSAGLMVLGASPAVALALPGALLAMAVTLLVIVLGARLGLGVAAGALAAAICFLGGGLGFVGLFGDACTHHGFTAAQCTWSGIIAHPGSIPSIVLGTLRDLPGTIAAQPRAYDGLLTTPVQQPLPNQQWYTPLFAWWLPQRSLLYGFAGAVCVLIMVVAARRSESRAWESYALAGVLTGIMPVIHIHTFIVMAVVLPLLALQWRRAGWLVLFSVAAVIALPRLISLIGGPHGSAAFGNTFPTVEAGWMYLGGGASRSQLSPAAVVGAVGGLLRAVVSPQYWAFWIANLGVVVPLCVVVSIAVALHRLGGAVGGVARRITSVFPEDLLRVALPFMAVFVVANLTVLQSWDWDNTKLLAFWYLGGALLTAALVVHWWRRWWRGVASAAIGLSVLLTGVLVLVRLLPWTPAGDAVGGPYTVASADEVQLAQTIAHTTPDNGVFLTEGRPNDPVLTLAGRTSMLGYYGWLWSYGTDFGTRYKDVRTMFEGCQALARGDCPIFGLLQRYHVDFVEMDDRTGSPGMVDDQPDLAWWERQGFPVVARSQHIVVYDVRHR